MQDNLREDIAGVDWPELQPHQDLARLQVWYWLVFSNTKCFLGVSVILLDDNSCLSRHVDALTYKCTPVGHTIVQGRDYPFADHEAYKQAWEYVSSRRFSKTRRAAADMLCM